MIYHNKPTFDQQEEEAVIRVLRSKWVAQGNETAQLENEFCEYLELPQGCAVAVSSGTAAIYLALTLLNAKGETVAYPAYTCTAVRNAIAHSGGLEEVVDSDRVTPNISLEALNRLRPKFAVVPHMYGLPVDISSIDSSIIVIEDCAQALGAKLNGRSVGLHGRVGIFSFYASKIMTAGGSGGMVVSLDKALIDAIKDYRDFDQKMDDQRRFNLSMTDLQAAVGRIQLLKLPGFLERRRDIFARYMQGVGDRYPILCTSLQNGEQVPYRCVMITNKVEKIRCHLEKIGINCINPLETWELLDVATDMPNAYAWTCRTLSLPIYPSLSQEEVEKIIEGVREVQ